MAMTIDQVEDWVRAQLVTAGEQGDETRVDRVGVNNQGDLVIILPNDDVYRVTVELIDPKTGRPLLAVG